MPATLLRFRVLHPDGERGRGCRGWCLRGATMRTADFPQGTPPIHRQRLLRPVHWPGNHQRQGEVVADAFKLTENSSEIPFEELFKGDALAIPYFQRPYKWTKKKIDTLCADVDSIIEETNTVHFLGAVIMFDPKAEHRGAFKREDVIDGQQRITTVYLMLCAAIRALIDNKAYEDAVHYFKTHVVAENTRRKGYEARLQPSHGDREALNAVIEDLLKTKAFRDELGPGFKYLHLKVSGKTPDSSGKRVKGSYEDARRYFRTRHELGGIDDVKEALDIVLSRLTIVQIRVVDTLVGPKIFDSLNSRQEAMTVGDLIRNDVFKREVERDPDWVEQLNDTRWLPFFNRFMDVSSKAFDDYFFPFGLTQDPNVKKSDVHARLMKTWTHLSPIEIIEALEQHQDCYLDLLDGKNSSKFAPPLAQRMKRFTDFRATGAVYPFIMSVTNAFNLGTISEKNAVDIMDVVESFLVRRALASVEPTGLHAVFKGLWRDIEGNPSAAATTAAIRKHKTVSIPTDDEITLKVVSENAYSSKITPYVLAELDRSLGGDEVSVAATNVEHVYPQTPKLQEWSAFEGQEGMRDRLANLLPLSAPMNKSLKNSKYSIKRVKFLEDSAFKMTRKFAETHEDWTPSAFKKREAQLVAEIKKRWPDI